MPRVNANVVAPIRVFIFDSHSETVDQLGKGFFRREPVQVIILANTKEGIDSMEARIVRSGTGRV